MSFELPPLPSMAGDHILSIEILLAVAIGLENGHQTKCNTVQQSMKYFQRQQNEWACKKINNLIQQSTYTSCIRSAAEQIREEKSFLDGRWRDRIEQNEDNNDSGD
jgi:hypothetical protein